MRLAYEELNRMANLPSKDLSRFNTWVRVLIFDGSEFMLNGAYFTEHTVNGELFYLVFTEHFNNMVFAGDEVTKIFTFERT